MFERIKQVLTLRINDNDISKRTRRRNLKIFMEIVKSDVDFLGILEGLEGGVVKGSHKVGEELKD